MHNDNFWQTSLDVLLEKTASPDPVPGGGSIAALTANLGAALIMMALRITIKKLKNEDDFLSSMLSQLELKMVDLKDCPKKDIESFNHFMNILKQTNINETEKKNAMNFAQKKLAIDTLSIAEPICDVISLLNKFYKKIHKNILADIGVGIFLLESALYSTLLNATINANMLKNKAEQEQLMIEKEKLAQSVAPKIIAIKTYVEKTLAL